MNKQNEVEKCYKNKIEIKEAQFFDDIQINDFDKYLIEKHDKITEIINNFNYTLKGK
jgi:hypothetical protein